MAEEDLADEPDIRLAPYFKSRASALGQGPWEVRPLRDFATASLNIADPQRFHQDIAFYPLAGLTGTPVPLLETGCSSVSAPPMGSMRNYPCLPYIVLAE